MALSCDEWGTIHSSVYGQAGALLRWVAVTPRAHGALRYRCPVTDSFVCLTDDETLAALGRPGARLRCPCCGEMHLLMQNGDAVDPAIVAAAPAP